MTNKIKTKYKRYRGNSRLPKYKSGGKLPEYGFGGFIGDVGKTLANYNPLGVAKTVLTGEGFYGEDDFSNKEFGRLNKLSSGVTKVAAPALATMAGGPLAGAAISGAQSQNVNERPAPMNTTNQYRGPSSQGYNPYTPTYAFGGQVGTPNAEIEGGEVVQTPNGEMPTVTQGGGLQQQSGDTFEAQGASHAQGGIDTEMPEGTRIFSDKLTNGDMTYADHAAPISKKLGKYEEVLSNPKATAIQKNTAKRMMTKLNSQLDGLFQEQEASKPQIQQPQQQFENGGELLTGLQGTTDYQFGDANQFAAGTNPYAATQSTAQPELYRTDTYLDKVDPVNQDPNFFQRAGQRLKDVDYGKLGYQAAQVAPALYNVGRGLFEESERYDPIYNPYEARALNELKGRKYNVQPELERNRLAAATSRRSLRNTAPSVGAYRANLAAIQAAEGRAGGETLARAQNIQNQYAADYAGALGQYGQQRAQAQAIAQQQTNQAQAAKERLLQTGISQLGKFGQQQYTNKLQFNAMDDLLANYTYDQKTGSFKPKTKRNKK